jgi:hypothetical protein
MLDDLVTFENSTDGAWAKVPTEGVLRAAVEILRRHGSPLVCPTSDGVLVCKEGVWAHGADLPAALKGLAETIARRDEERRKRGG